MDVDLGDVITIGVETTLNLNWPTPRSAVLPVALAVSIVRFSGTLAVSFIPSSSPPAPSASPPTGTHLAADPARPPTPSPNPPPHRPTSLAFTFLDDYRLDLSVRSLVGSRSRLQDVPKIAQLIESRVHAWFDERAVEPRFQQIVLPSLWPRKHNTRGGDADIAVTEDDDQDVDPNEQNVLPPGNRPSTPSLGPPFIPNPSAASTLEARIEAEGTKLRDAEIRANGHRPQSATRTDSADGMRWRGDQAIRPRPASRLSTGGLRGAQSR